MKRTILILASCLCVSAYRVMAASAEFAFRDDPETGTMTLYEDDAPVFSFVYEPGRVEHAEGVEDRALRAGYLHPIYDLDGEPITRGPHVSDHPHHRGAWLSWPWMRVRGQQVELWHPSPLRQRFVRWIEQQTAPGHATLIGENYWILDGDTVGREVVNATAHSTDDTGRIIDLTYTVEAIDEPIEVRGQSQRGYGGLCVRTAQSLQGGQLRTHEGALEGDDDGSRYDWASLSDEHRGIAVFAHPDNPGAPQTWLIRHSYGGILNPQWPGREVATLTPGEPVTLRYRLYIHRGAADQERLDAVYRDWINKAAE